MCALLDNRFVEGKLPQLKAGFLYPGFFVARPRGFRRDSLVFCENQVPQLWSVQLKYFSVSLYSFARENGSFKHGAWNHIKLATSVDDATWWSFHTSFWTNIQAILEEREGKISKTECSCFYANSPFSIRTRMRMRYDWIAAMLIVRSFVVPDKLESELENLLPSFIWPGTDGSVRSPEFRLNREMFGQSPTVCLQTNDRKLLAVKKTLLSDLEIGISKSLFSSLYLYDK